MIGGALQRITVEVGGKIAASLGASLRAAQTQVSSFGRNVSRTMNDAALSGRKGFKGMLDNALWQGAAAGAAAIGVGMMASVKAAATFEQSLTDISKTANLGQAETKALGAEILKLTAADKTNQSAEKLAAGIKTLVGNGLALKDAQAAILGIGRVATATGSDITEVADTSYQLMQNLKVRAQDVGKTFEVLAAAGKEGSFELKDMAREFPKVASSAQKLGISGTQGAASLAAMLQVVRRGASDSSTAANNLVNLMEKITGKDAVKNFAKYGVNIEKVVKNAQKNGLDPLEESIKVIQQITKGDPFKINDLFGDMQVKAALAPLLKDFKDFQDIRDRALKSNGVIDKDYAKQLDTFTGRMDSFRNATDRLSISVGNALLPVLTKVSIKLIPIAEGMANFVSQHPRIATGIAVLAGAFAGLVIVLPIIAGVVSAIGTIGAAITAATPIIAGLGTVLAIAGGPITLIIAGIALIGVGIYALVKNWGSVKAAAAGAWQGVVATWGQFTTWIGGVFNQAVAVIRAWGPKVLGVMFPIPAMIIRLFRGSGIGQNIITSIIDGLKAKFGALVGWIRGAWSNISGMFGGGGGAPAAAPQPPGRASGGPVRAGHPYIVGERRRELFVPGMDGAIIPRVARPAGGGGGVTINAPVTINAAGGDAMAIRDQVRMAFEDLIARAYGDYRVALND
jgi:TP901 family phage tail tape measure protein